MGTDAFSAITGFFNDSTSDDVIRVGSPDALSKFYERLGQQYNLDELQDILDCEDNMLIIAGAGSGKTTSLMLKIIRDILSGKLLKWVEIDGRKYLHIKKILVSTFLKTGADELSKKFDELCKDFKIVGVHSSNIAFKTIHSEVYAALKEMGMKIDIIEPSKARELLAQACRHYNVRSVMGRSKTLTKEDMGDIESIFAYVRNRLDGDKYNHPLMSEYGLDSTNVPAILEVFKLLKVGEEKQDFEDLEETLYDAYKKFPNVLNFIKSRYDYIYVDEFQDTSQLQYAILEPYFKSAEGYLTIGDDDQCVVNTTIRSSKGLKNISDIRVGDSVLSSLGRDKVGYMPVDNTSKKMVNEELVVIKTKRGHVLKGTKDHIMFVDYPILEDKYTVYLMYKKELGFRLGQTAGQRVNGAAGERHGFAQRLNNETGEKLWVLNQCDTADESRDLEKYYSTTFGIPTYMFNLDRDYKHIRYNYEELKEFHKTENSFENGLNLLNKVGYSFDYPHYSPKAKNHNKCVLKHTVFGSSLKSSNGYKHEIYVCTSNSEYVEVLSDYLAITHRKPTKNRQEYWDCRNTSVDVDFQLRKIKEIKSACRVKGIPLEIKRSIKIMDKSYDFMPLGGVIEGMRVPVIEDSGFIDDEIVEVSKEQYDGYVYDLSVPITRNFVANGIFIKNCIYSWRGSDSALIQKNFEIDYKPTVKKLTMNRRCPKNILDSVIPSIEKNTARHPKKLQATDKEGTLNIVIDGGVTYLAKSIKEDLSRSEKVGILGRTNADLLIPALVLMIDGYDSFSISNSLSLDDRIPSHVLGIMQLITHRYTGDFEGYLKLFLSKYNSYQATKICDTLSATTDCTLYNMDLEDIRHSAPDLFPIIRMLRQEVKVDPVKAYLSLLEIMEQEVYNGKTIYAQRARDFTYYIRRIIKEHDSLKNKTIEELYRLFHIELPAKLKGKKVQRVKTTDKNGKIKYETPVDNAYVRITTVHDAKGKEWDNVYIWNDVDGCFPNSVGNRELTTEEFEEERRVHYIAWTRPRKKLTVLTRSDRPMGFLGECLLNDETKANIIEMSENRRRAKDMNSFNHKEVFRKKEDTSETDSEDMVETEKTWRDYLKEYILKYTNYNKICTPEGSHLDVCLIKLGGYDGLKGYLEEFKLENYPIDELEGVISDILESKYSTY